jgi:hypothetical protein
MDMFSIKLGLFKTKILMFIGCGNTAGNEIELYKSFLITPSPPPPSSCKLFGNSSKTVGF